MTKKRRMFDIDLPDEDVPAAETKALGGLRRGPMATTVWKSIAQGSTKPSL